MPVQVGLEATVSMVVGEADTAVALGSGEVHVLGTPRLVALAEQATCAAVAGHLDDGHTSVGVRVEMAHLAASGLGRTVTATAHLDEVAGRRLRFSVTAFDDAGTEVGRGSVARVVVDRARFTASAG